MLMLLYRYPFLRKTLACLIVAALVSSPLMFNVKKVNAAGALTSVYNRTTDSRPSATPVTYVTSFTFDSTTAIKCINIVLSDSATGGSKPTGMSTTGAAKVSISGGGLTDGNWTLYNTVDGTLQYEYATGGSPTVSPATITTSGITNPSSAGTVYAQITTYTTLSTHTCSGEVDAGTAAFSIKTGQALSVTVNPSLTFAINGVGSGQNINGSSTTVTTVTDANTIPLGTVTTSNNAVAAHDLVVTTNATNGYTVYASYSGVLTNDGGDTITDFTGTNTSPTTFVAAGAAEAFGYTTESTNLSGTPTRFSANKWAKFEAWNYEVAKSTAAVNAESTKIGYQAAITGTTEAGTYTTTIVLTATPTY